MRGTRLACAFRGHLRLLDSCTWSCANFYSSSFLPRWTSAEPCCRLLSNESLESHGTADEGSAYPIENHDPRATSSKPLSSKTQKLLHREELVTSFATRIGISGGQSADAFNHSDRFQGGEEGSVSATDTSRDSVPKSIKDEGAVRHEKRLQKKQRAEKKAEKHKTPVYPDHQVYDSWMDTHKQQLGAARQYMQEALNVNPDALITQLYSRGALSQAALLPGAPPRQPAEVAGSRGDRSPARGKGRGRKPPKAPSAEATPDCEALGQGGNQHYGGAGVVGAERLAQRCSTPRSEAGSCLDGTIAPWGDVGGAREGGGEGEAQHAQQQMQGQPRMVKVVEEWQEVLREAGLRLEPVGKLALKHPNLLVVPPPGGREATLGRLRHMKELLHTDQEQLELLINQAPQLLHSSAADIIRRLEFLRLHAHLDRNPEATLKLAPQLLWVPEEQLSSNIRSLVPLCRSAREYATLVKWHPKLLLAASTARVNSMLRVLGQLLPSGYDARQVLRHRTQLLLSRPRLLAKNWQELKLVCSQLPTWQAELDSLLSFPGSTAQQPDGKAAAEPAAAVGQGNTEVDDFWGEVHSAAADEHYGVWGAGRGAEGQRGAGVSGSSLRFLAPSPSPSPLQYKLLALLLDSRREKVRRLQFLLEKHREAAAAGEEPLVELLTMRLRVFERKFPGLLEWQERQEGGGGRRKGSGGSWTGWRRMGRSRRANCSSSCNRSSRSRNGRCSNAGRGYPSGGDAGTRGREACTYSIDAVWLSGNLGCTNAASSALVSEGWLGPGEVRQTMCSPVAACYS